VAPAFAIKTVESFLGVKINHVIVINFTNFPALVNAMGGVTTPVAASTRRSAAASPTAARR
jgi:anionic cell wall polymer biosynthesis LytR-Cps2A-Psr (LCP) family protein